MPSALVRCLLCTDTEEVHLVGNLGDGRREVECRSCGYRWTHGEVTPQPAPVTTFESPKKHFPQPEDVDTDVLARPLR